MRWRSTCGATSQRAGSFGWTVASSACGDLLLLGRHPLVADEVVDRVERLVLDLGRRLQQLFLQGEVDLLQAGLHLLQGVDGLIDDQHAQGGRRRLAVRVGDAERDLAFLTGQVDVCLSALDVDLQIVARMDVDDPAIADDLAGGQDLIGVDFERAEDVGRQVDLAASPCRP